MKTLGIRERARRERAKRECAIGGLDAGKRFEHALPVARMFTLIELLVVVCVIAILVALLMPATKAMFRKADQMECFSHAAMIGKASTQYAARYGFTIDHVRSYNKHQGVNWGRTFYEDAAFNYGYKVDPADSGDHFSYADKYDLFHCPLDTTGGTRSFVLNWDQLYGRGHRPEQTIPMGYRGNIDPNDTAYGPYCRSRNGISGVRTGLHRNPSSVLLFCERWAYGNNLDGYSHCQFQRFTQGEFGSGGLQNPSIVFVDGHVEQVPPATALALDYGNDLDD